MDRFYVLAGKRLFTPALPLQGALNLARDLVEISFEQALVLDEDRRICYLVNRQYDN